MIDSRLLAGFTSCFPWTTCQFSQLNGQGVAGFRAARMRAERLVQKGLLCTAVMDCQQITLGDDCGSPATAWFLVPRAAFNK